MFSLLATPSKVPQMEAKEVKSTAGKSATTTQSLSGPFVRLSKKSGRATMLVRGKSRKNNRKQGASALPPTLNTTITFRHTYRFETSSAITTFGVTGAMLSGAFGGICTNSNTAVTGWVSSAKIHKVVIWPGLSSSSSVPEVLWSGIVGAISKDVSVSNALPGGVTIERAVVSRPPKDTLCEAWINLPTLGNSNLFSLGNVPAQSIIDVTITAQIRNNLGGYVLGVTTATLGNAYYTALDGPAVNKCVPVGLPTTN